MLELARLDDLPADYRAALGEQNLVPLWPSLRAVLPPGQPRPRTQATCWHYESLRPLLLQAGELTPIEKAERRVLVLANPGHGLDKMQASAAIYLYGCIDKCIHYSSCSDPGTCQKSRRGYYCT